MLSCRFMVKCSIVLHDYLPIEVIFIINEFVGYNSRYIKIQEYDSDMRHSFPSSSWYFSSLDKALIFAKKTGLDDPQLKDIIFHFNQSYDCSEFTWTRRWKPFEYDRVPLKSDFVLQFQMWDNDIDWQDC